MRRLFKQLKRGNVLRAAGGYAVLAWQLIQVADILFPILGVPTWVTTMVVILVVIGFPVTVVVSWIYQWTPAGIMTEQDADAAGHTEPIGNGMSEEILNLLAKIQGLKVIGRTSSFAFKGRNEDLRLIGQTLGVSTVLEGSAPRHVFPALRFGMPWLPTWSIL
jgi:hypothetical protein